MVLVGLSGLTYSVSFLQKDFIHSVQKFIANAFSIGIVRNMVPGGTLEIIREFLKKIDLAKISKKGPAQFPQVLNQLTEQLRREMPKGGRHWGMARKCLNLFFRDAVYNFYLRKEYHLAKFEKVLEIPLDSYVGHALRRQARDEGRDVPPWRTVKGLTPEASAKFQAFALEIAKRRRTKRVHLDVFYWRAESLHKSEGQRVGEVRDGRHQAVSHDRR